ncbi:MAG: sulfatase [Vicinamibacteria bacterium]
MSLGRALAMGASLFGLLAAAASTPGAAAETAPNLLLLVLEDTPASAFSLMPHVRQRIVARGLSFANAFAVSPLSAPARASILTGRYPHNHGVPTNAPPRGSYRRFVESGRESATLATWLAAAGYRTGLVGKYMNFYPMRGEAPRHVPAGWSSWFATAFSEAYYGFEVVQDGRGASYADRAQDYQTDVLREAALRFLAAGASQPFFLYLAPFAPHDPATPADRHDALFPDLKAPRSPAFDEEDLADKPAWLRERPHVDAAALDERHRSRMRSLQAVDEMVEALCAALENSGRLERTFVLLTSDGGDQQGDHRLVGPVGDPYDASVRIPLVVRGPEIPAGAVSDAIALQIDLAPTIAALGGAAPSAEFDGRSLARLLQGRATLRDWRKDLLIEQAQDEGPLGGRGGEPAGVPDYAALRSAEWLYVEHASGERELYDLALDAPQLDSLHALAAPELLASLSSRLAALRACAGDGCRR